MEPQSVIKLLLKKNRITREALINIAKLSGKCWDGNRQCSDPQHVANEALKKVMNKEDFEYLDALPYTKVKVTRNGKVSY